MQRGKRGTWLTIAALAGTLLAGMYVYSTRRLRRLEHEFPPIGHYVTVDGLRMHYVSKGSEKPVVFLHGADGILQDYTMTVMDEAAREYRAIAFDRPGHGYSERPSMEVATPVVQARLLHGALEQLGVRKPVLVGHSWSGALVLAYALAFPTEVAGLVLLGGVAYGDDGVGDPMYYMYHIPDIPLLGGLLLSTALVPVGRALGKPIIERVFRPNSPDEAPPGWIDAMIAFAVRPEQFKANSEDMRVVNPALRALSPRYGEIKVPVVIVTGDSDAVVRPEDHSYPLHEHIPHSKLIVLPETGHEIPHTRPQAVIDALHLAWSEAEPE